MEKEGQIVDIRTGEVVGHVDQDTLAYLREEAAKAHGFPSWEEYLEKELHPLMEKMDEERKRSLN